MSDLSGSSSSMERHLFRPAAAPSSAAVPEPPEARLWFWGGGALVVLAAVFLAVPTLGAGFLLYDDQTYIVHNPILRAPFLEAAQRSFADAYAFNYHPLHLISYWADYQLWGLNPIGYRVSHVLYYALSCLLFWRLAKAFLPAEAALWTALLFALHPLHAESVSWISERKDILCLLFSMLSLRVWLAFAHAPSWTRYLLTLPCVALALWSKSAAVVLPVLAVLIAYLAPARVPSKLRLRTALLALLPWVLLGALQMGLEMRAHGEHGGIVEYPGGSLWTSLLTQAWIELRFFTKHLFPWPLSPTADVAPIVAWMDWRLWVALATWAVVFWGLWRVRMQTRWPLFVFLWIVLAMAPTSNLVPIASIYADRWLLLGTIGGMLGLGCGVERAGSYWPREGPEKTDFRSQRSSLAESRLRHTGTLVRRHVLRLRTRLGGR